MVSWRSAMIVGADILNVFFVAGAAAAVTPGGLTAGGHFFPGAVSGSCCSSCWSFESASSFPAITWKRPFGYVLLTAYGVYMVVSYLIPASV